MQGTGAVEETTGKVLGAAINFTEKWSNALDTMQKTTVKANTAVSIQRIEQEAALDTNINNYDIYAQKLDKLKNEHIKGFNNKMVEQGASIELDYDINMSKVNIDNIFKKKQIVSAQFSLDTDIEASINKQVSNPAIAEAERLRMLATIDENVSSGIISAEDGKKKKDEALKSVVSYSIYNDAATKEEDSLVLSELKKGKNGIYGFLDASDTLSMIQDSQKRIFQNNQTYKRDVEDSQKIRNDNIIEKMLAQDLTIKDIEDEEAIPEEQGGMKRSVLNTYKNSVINGINKDLNKMLTEKSDKEPTKRAIEVKKYNDLIDNFIDDELDSWKAKDMLARAYADGIIDKNEQKFLNDLNNNLSDISLNRSTSPIAGAIKGIKEFWRHQKIATDEDLAISIKKLVGGIMAGDKPEEAQKKIMSDSVKSTFADYASYPEDGREKIDKATGRRFKVYPDGTWAWEEAKKSQGATNTEKK